MFTSMQPSDRAIRLVSIPVGSAPTAANPFDVGSHLRSREVTSARLLCDSSQGGAPRSSPLVGVAASRAASTSQELQHPGRQSAAIRSAMGQRGFCEVDRPTMTTAPAKTGGAIEQPLAIDNRTQRVATLPVARAPQRVRPMRSMPTDSRLVSSGRARCGAEGCSVHGHTVARAADAFLRRKGKAVAHTGRFTTPPVEAAEAHCRHLWVIAWKDGQLTTDEDTLMCGCEAVVFETMKADATEEVRNAMSQRRGFESPQFDRRLRELRGKVVRFRQRLPQPDPTPAGPAAQRKAA
jgi:hypothetical protein